jgi:hypothetical protein
MKQKYLPNGRMKELIIFGRSPFINRLNLDKLDYTRFDTCCINGNIPQLKRVDYLVSADEFCKPYIRPETEWISKNNGWNIVKSEQTIQQIQRLSWKHLSSDLAVNFAIMRGYKTIYLAGVDLVEDVNPQFHYNGSLYKHRYMNETHRSEKEYIKRLGKDYDVNIYQLNPKCDWLEYKDIGLL